MKTQYITDGSLRADLIEMFGRDYISQEAVETVGKDDEHATKIADGYHETYERAMLLRALILIANEDTVLAKQLVDALKLATSLTVNKEGGCCLKYGVGAYTSFRNVSQHLKSGILNIGYYLECRHAS